MTARIPVHQFCAVISAASGWVLIVFLITFSATVTANKTFLNREVDMNTMNTRDQKISTSEDTSAQDLRMQTEVIGEGPPLVLVGGGLTGWKSWEPHAERLATTRTVLACSR